MRFREPCWPAVLSLLLLSCARTPDSYPVPEQHAAFRVGGIPSSEFLTMDDPEVLKRIVKDINVNDPGPWRWTGAEPELKFALRESENRTLIVDFVIHERTFGDTGPVAISFYINDRLAGEERYTSEGDKTFEKAIPSQWLSPGVENRVRMRVHPTWKTPQGTVLGILLKRVGFVE